MSDRRFLISVTTIIMIVLTASLTSAGTYTEDFTTTEFRDSLNTTAFWNTTAGELKLFALPRIVGSVGWPDLAQDVDVAGDHAYAGDFSGLKVIDISDPSDPAVVGSVNTPSAVERVFVDGDHAYLAAGGAGLQVIDISDPTNPTVAGSFNTPGFAGGLYVAGDRAYVADGFSLEVIDVSDPMNPVLAGSIQTDEFVGVYVSGDHAYVAGSVAGLLVIDISDPANPTLAASLVTPANSVAISVSGDYAYLADGSGLQVVDISDPTIPTLAASLGLPGSAPLDVSISGDRAYVTNITGLQLVDISDPTNPVLVSSLDTPDFAYRLTVDGDHAFIADGGSGLQVIQIGGVLSGPVLAGSYNTPNSAAGVAVAGDHAFVADTFAGLQVIDISDPTSLSFAGSYDTPDAASDVAVAGDHAFVADQFAGLQVIDISDPTSLSFAGSYDTPDKARGVAVAGDHAFVADANSGLQVIDISDPTNPAFAGSYDTPGTASGVAVAGDHAFVADGASGLQVIDISDPTNPVLAGSYDTPESAFGVAVAGDHAFVADFASGLQVIDISDPTIPVLAGSYDTPDIAFGVAVAGDHAFVADFASGLQVIDISDPTIPVLAGSYDTPDLARGVALAGDHAFVASGTSGLPVIRVRQSEVASETDVGQSLSVDGGTNTIPRARLTTTQTSGVSWEVSADAGTSWSPMTPDGTWTPSTTPGDELRWRSAHTWSPGLNPTVSELTLDWLNEFGLVTSIEDVGNDQGRQVRVNWSRSGYDFLGDASQIVEYSLYRRIGGESATRSTGGSQHHPINPPGWDFVLTVPADAEEEYSVVAPTLVDSTETQGVQWSVFMVRARVAPGLFFDSPPDSGYSIDNLAPGVPTNLVFIEPEVLAWDEATEEDFAYHSVHGSESAVFDSTAILISHTVEPTLDVSGAPFLHYHVTTSDLSGNEGDAASIQSQTVSVTAIGSAPRAFALRAARPNPFRSATSIGFSLATDEVVRLTVYDATGRLVRELAGDFHARGQYEVEWDGKSDAGQRVAQGIYFARVEAGTFRASRRLVLIR